MTRLLMCPPDYFDVDYDINPWMTDNQHTVDKQKAKEQWQQLYNALTKVALVNLVDPQPDLPDMVFTANAGYYMEDHNLIFVANFRNKQRKGEEIHFVEWFRKNGFSIYYPNLPFEGEGDLLGDNRDHYIAYGFRSTARLAQDFPFNRIRYLKEVDLVDPRFYHLDTCFMPLKNHGALWYPDAFGSHGKKIIRTSVEVENSIEVTEEEALTFCCNAVIVNDDVFMPKCESVAEKLTNLGYNVQQFEMSEFMKSGGACKCLVMNLG